MYQLTYSKLDRLALYLEQSNNWILPYVVFNILINLIVFSAIVLTIPSGLKREAEIVPIVTIESTNTPVPTLTLTATSTPYCEAYSNRDVAINIRQAPNANSRLIGTIPPHARIRLLEQASEWFRIEEGWVSGTNLNISVDCEFD